MGLNQTSFKKGNLGRKLSKETKKKKISPNHRLKGEKHWQGKGGITQNKD